MEQDNTFEYWLGAIKQWHQRHRSTSPGTTAAISKRFEKYHYEYEKHMAEYRKTGKPSVLAKANAILEKAATEFKILKKLELIGTLSK